MYSFVLVGQWVFVRCASFCNIEHCIAEDILCEQILVTFKEMCICVSVHCTVEDILCEQILVGQEMGQDRGEEITLSGWTTDIHGWTHTKYTKYILSTLHLTDFVYMY